ncbi:CotH kinase family protein [Salibacterium salarium]|uniref:CotH kinase family protein n=1 Tax=Salibacterium salarium TaxID=284579 RepID=UPI00163A1F14|nr:CotH kinase family protein [Salibacterium salarium]
MNNKKIKRIALLLLPLAVLTGAAVFIFAGGSDVEFEDENLETAIREEIRKPEGPIRQEDLENVDTLDLSNSGIESIEGLENVTTVRNLDLQGNRMEDIQALEDLIYLEDLNLRGNHIEDLSALEGMERMVTLDVRDTGIDDLSPISTMTALTDLNVRGNDITSLEPIKNMAELRQLNVRNNHITDISVLTELTYLKDINLRNNRIEDFSPVFELPRLTKRLFVSGNPGLKMKDFVSLYDQVENMDIDEPERALVFNKDGGSYKDSQMIELSQLMGKEGTIRYTLDGSEPTLENEEVKEYTEPLEIDETTVLKAKFYDQYGNEGEMVSNTYVIGEESEFPIVSISSNPENFFGEATGIYAEGAKFDEDAPVPEETANYSQSGDLWEREGTVEIYNSDGTEMIHQQAGVRLHGNKSRYYPKKSFRLYARSDYSSENTFGYPLFESEDDQEYNRLLLRNSGNDWDKTSFRDAFIQELIEGFDVEKQAYEPALLYVNGEYWGIYNLRERIDDDYFEFKYGILEDNIDYLEGDGEVRIGNNIHYKNMTSYMEDNDVRDPDVYQQITEQLDVNNFIDYNIAEIYARNTDWPSNNNRYWREKPNGKWRWTVFDTDFGFGAIGGETSYTHHTLDFATEAGNDSWPNTDWSTMMLRTLLENKEFQSQFIGTFSHYLNTTFNEEKVVSKLDEFEAMYEPEMEKNIERWGEPDSMEQWRDNVNVMREFGQVRADYSYAHLIDYFDLDGYANLTFHMEGNHSLEVYGEEVPLENGEWSGTYAADTPLEITVDGEPAELSTNDDAVEIDEQGRIIPSVAADTEVEITDSNGESAGVIQITGEKVEKENITLEAGEEWNWQEELETDGAYASISNAGLGEMNNDTFTAEAAGDELLTVHNEDDKVIAMARIQIIDPAKEARVYNEGHPAAQYEGMWEESENDSHHKGSAVFSETAGDQIEITFEGTGIRWLGFKGPTQGIADIEIDGEAVEEVDTFAKESSFNRELVSIDGLEEGQHTMTITVTGEKQEKSNNNRVHIDSFEVLQE